MRAKDCDLIHSLLKVEELTGLGWVIRRGDYSTHHRLLAVTSYVLRFVEILKCTRRHDAADMHPKEPHAGCQGDFQSIEAVDH